ncbi:MAG: hypothetical protein N3A58_02510 [Spirochaetes bacterium]|nr:hypothetical protein [Spirochaetota bacterium]
MNNLNSKDLKDIEEKLDIIKSLLLESEKKIYENGFYYILFGFSALLFTILSYLLFNLNLEKYFVPYSILFVFILFTIVFLYSKKRYSKSSSSNIKNIFIKFLGYLWLFNSIGYFLVIFVSLMFYRKFNFKIYFSIISIYLGTNFILSSYLVQNGKVIRFSGYLWYITSIIFLFIKESIYFPIFFSISVFFLELLPGIVLYRNYKKIKK